MSLRFNMLLEEAGISPADVRLLRHQPKVGGRALIDVWRGERDQFEAYQAVQPVTKRAHFTRPYWASFIGTWDGRTVFVGLYAVGAPETVTEDIPIPIRGGIDPAGTVDRFPTRHVDVLSRYEGRLYIDWGGGSSGKRAWVQRAEAQDKPITELHANAAEEPFPGFLQLASPLSALADAPLSWVQRLAAAKGVYLLTCPRDGSLYVGSATGDDGFWSRWTEYRANGHGGNVALRGRDPSDFIVSVLQVAGSSDTIDDILAAEMLWMRKLQSRGLGLNR